MLKRNLPWLVLVLLWTLLDQITKHLIWKTQGISLTPFLDIVKVYNRGFAFGLFNDHTGVVKDIFYYGVPFLTLAVVLYALLRSENRLTKFALTLIAGGGLGNLADRLFLGQVRDFIDFHIGNWHYPAFNLADIFVSLGIFLLLVNLVRERETKRV
jgi:signal peptidase II